MHVHSPIFHGQLKEKNVRPITLIVCVLGRVEKMPKNRLKDCYKMSSSFPQFSVDEIMAVRIYIPFILFH